MDPEIKAKLELINKSIEKLVSIIQTMNFSIGQLALILERSQKS